MANSIDVFEFQIPKKYGSVVFFKDKETMEKWCNKWKCYAPLIGEGLTLLFAKVFRTPTGTSMLHQAAQVIHDRYFLSKLHLLTMSN